MNVSGFSPGPGAPSVFTLKIRLPPDESLIKELKAGCCQRRIKKSVQLRCMGDKARTLGAGWLLGYAVNIVTGFEGIVAEESDASGRPLLSAFPELYVSLAHSGPYIVCALSPFLCGIDVEKGSPELIRLAEMFLSPLEYQQSRTVERGNLEAWLLDVWTMKEAYLKAKGTGLLTEPAKVTIRIDGSSLHVNDGSTPCAGLCWSAYRQQLEGGYKLALCWSNQI